MQSPDRRQIARKSRGVALPAMFLACALVLGVLERMIPFQPPVPGVHLGLANVAVLAALYLFPFGQCLILVLLKCVMTALFTGSFVSLLYSLAGSLLSLFGMACVIRLCGRLLGPVGVSVLGAVLHHIGQLAAAALVMRTGAVIVFLPVMLVSGVITGTLTGLAVRWALPVIENRE